LKHAERQRHRNAFIHSHERAAPAGMRSFLNFAEGF
jgi:hypothetical protein